MALVVVLWVALWVCTCPNPSILTWDLCILLSALFYKKTTLSAISSIRR